jgi:hypothetical protein
LTTILRALEYGGAPPPVVALVLHWQNYDVVNQSAFHSGCIIFPMMRQENFSWVVIIILIRRSGDSYKPWSSFF